MSGTETGRRAASPISVIKDLGRLVPKQINDEIQLALRQLKAKGINVGVAAGLAVAALFFLSAMGIALLVAGIMGLAEVMPAWLAALVVAAFFLLLILILVAIAVPKAKKAMPLMPEDALRGVKHDLGILKEGSSFDEKTLDKPEVSKEEKERLKAEKDAEKAKKQSEKDELSYADLKARSDARRAHLAELRDRLGKQAGSAEKTAEKAYGIKERLQKFRPGSGGPEHK
ncbi:phage holin family protein [Zhihengliuella salsuginis]|uniref:Holin-X, holin superfamily III n=1 Tax=Zhihengliuella salsuginis TaxID=578222 RepID=A0ABQ3GKY4_9MICC|nr:phage holin family protein [Zhihengliuella salsuginis]GHD07759.1 hypothetical protein GCM10008096_18900 [Zhihengliuella salsuginis]